MQPAALPPCSLQHRLAHPRACLLLPHPRALLRRCRQPPRFGSDPLPARIQAVGAGPWTATPAGPPALRIQAFGAGPWTATPADPPPGRSRAVGAGPWTATPAGPSRMPSPRPQARRWACSRRPAGARHQLSPAGSAAACARLRLRPAPHSPDPRGAWPLTRRRPPPRQTVVGPQAADCPARTGQRQMSPLSLGSLPLLLSPGSPPLHLSSTDSPPPGSPPPDSPPPGALLPGSLPPGCWWPHQSQQPERRPAWPHAECRRWRWMHVQLVLLMQPPRPLQSAQPQPPPKPPKQPAAALCQTGTPVPVLRRRPPRTSQCSEAMLNPRTVRHLWLPTDRPPVRPCLLPWDPQAAQHRLPDSQPRAEARSSAWALPRTRSP